MTLPLRKDAATNWTNYITTAHQLLESGKWVANTNICKAINLPVRTGQGYWKQLKSRLANQVEEDEQGRLRMKVNYKDTGPSFDPIIMD